MAEGIGTYAVVGAVVLAVTFLLDPAGSYFGMQGIPAVKYLPIELALFGLPWLVLAQGRGIALSRSFFAVALLVLLVLGGGAFTVFVEGHSPDDSFLGRGVGMLAVFTGYVAAFRPQAWRKIEQWMWRCGYVAAVVMWVALLVWRTGDHFVDAPHIYHEEIFPCAAAAIALYAKPRGRLEKLVFTPMFFSAAIMSMKNTGFLAAAIAGVFISIVVWRRPQRRWLIRAGTRFILATTILVCLGLAVAAVRLSPESLPNGTPALRLATYPLRLRMFLASPFGGAWFAGSPDADLGYRIVQTHSDVLDLLAYGGLLALLLAVPVLKVVVRAAKAIVLNDGVGDRSTIYVLALLPLIGMEMTVNPIWHHPYIMLLFWLAVGHELASLNGKHIEHHRAYPQ